MKVTFIGLGIMGSRMAANLVKSGIDLTVYNRTQEPKRILEKKGAKSVESIEDGVKDADIVFSMLSDPKVVEEVMLNQALPSMKKKALWVDTSTVNPSFSVQAAQKATDAGIRFIDAPVAGSKPQAENAELVFFVGGDKKDLEEATPFMNHMGGKILPMGEVGKGSSMKMIVNMMLAQNMVVFTEALLLGQSMGLDKDFLLNVVPNLPVMAPFTKFKAENIRSEDWEEQFPLELMYKDLHLASLTGEETNQALPLNDLVKELYGKAKNEGMGRLDFSAIYGYLAP
ncbi:MAG: NAD(P)-dependent oxidoreductase [Bacteroidota bacterium]